MPFATFGASALAVAFSSADFHRAKLGPSADRAHVANTRNVVKVFMEIAYRTAMLNAALAEPSTETATGTCAPPNDCVRTNCTCPLPAWITGIGSPETVTCTRLRFDATEGSRPLTCSVTVSPALKNVTPANDAPPNPPWA